jgi:RHS repeat-associated protein
MTYDGDGKRRSYADSVILRNFLWDGENIARQTDVNNLTDRNYTLNPQLYGELISQDGPAFHHYDALGSTRNLTDTNQAVTDTRDYTAFGETNASSGTNLNRFWWLGKCGYYLQPDLGNVWVRARIEEPVDGRMKTRDPIIRLRALWPYLYCKNRPTRLVDPSGLDASKCPCDGLRQQVRDLVNEIERKSSHWGFRQAACGRLNELVATAGRKCNDHRFDDTYRKDCGEIRKRKKWNECMTLCTSDPDTYVPGFNKASLANTGVDAVLDIIKSGGSPDSPTPGDFHGGTFREDAKGACTEYCRRRWGWVPLPEPEYLTQEDVHDLFISPMETTLGPG